MKITVREILTQLEELKSFNSRYKSFPLVTEEEAEAFECRFHIRLPEDFRWFITNVHNGSLGPGMGRGLNPLYEIQRVLEVQASIEHVSADQVLRHNFSPPSTIEESEQLPMLCAPGMLPIAHAGCGRDYYLCVSGTERGHIWYRGRLWFLFAALDNHPAYKAYPPDFDFDADDDNGESIIDENCRIFQQWVTQLLSPQNTYRVTFLEWYVLWLHESLQRWRKGVKPKSIWEDWFLPLEQ